MPKDLLLEIGTEEIPPQKLPTISEKLKGDLVSKFEENYLQFTGCEIYHTPRRLVSLIKKLEEEQIDRTNQIKGPPKSVGFDNRGEPTKQAVGFCQSHGVKVSDLTIKETPNGEYLFLEEPVEGAKTAEILPSVLKELIVDLSTEEAMRWDKSGLKFIRPIRWICCLWGEDTVSFKVGNLKSSNLTRGHRFFGRKKIQVAKVANYFESLKENYVILDPKNRRSKIEKALEDVGQKINGKYEQDQELVDEITNSTEYPTPVAGEFGEEFLKLPPEVLATTMKEQQKFVPYIRNGKVIPYFVGFRDGTSQGVEEIKKWYQRILKSRLADSQYFFEEDRKRSLAEWSKELKSVIFIEGLGSVKDKVARMRRFATEIGKRVGFTNLDEIDRCAFLCKADLSCGLVNEFPSLEGKMGGIYARLDGETELVWKGIYEHYLPRTRTDALPEQETAMAVSLADKLDTVVGSLLIGEEPTGSKDPYGLRRKANGIIRICIEKEIDLDFFELIKDTKELYEVYDIKSSYQKVKNFFQDRLYQFLLNHYCIDYDILDCVTHKPHGNFWTVYLRAKSLESIREREEFESLIVGFSRAKNIAEDGKEKEFDKSLFKEDAERNLWRAYLKAESKIEDLQETRDYRLILEHLISLREPVDKYFDQVLVMAEDKNLRKNRLAFLRSLVDLFYKVGDLSKIVVENQDQK